MVVNIAESGAKHHKPTYIHTYIDERKWKISKFTKNPPQKIK
jgi:hypothetical protein